MLTESDYFSQRREKKKNAEKNDKDRLQYRQRVYVSFVIYPV